MNVDDSHLTDIHDALSEAIEGGTPHQKKALLKALVAEIRVEGNEAAPLYRLPRAGLGIVELWWVVVSVTRTEASLSLARESLSSRMDRDCTTDAMETGGHRPRFEHLVLRETVAPAPVRARRRSAPGAGARRSDPGGLRVELVQLVRDVVKEPRLDDQAVFEPHDLDCEVGQRPARSRARDPQQRHSVSVAGEQLERLHPHGAAGFAREQSEVLLELRPAMTVTREPLRRAHMPDERGSEERAETCDVAAGEGLEGGPELAGVGVLQPASNRSFAVRLISQRPTSPALRAGRDRRWQTAVNQNLKRRSRGAP